MKCRQMFTVGSTFFKTLVSHHGPFKPLFISLTFKIASTSSPLPGLLKEKMDCFTDIYSSITGYALHHINI